MDTYTGTLVTLILANVALSSYRLNDNNEGRASLRELTSSVSGLFRGQAHDQQRNSKRLALIFLPVYALAMTSDWMQVGYHFSFDSPGITPLRLPCVWIYTLTKGHIHTHTGTLFLPVIQRNSSAA